jgi:membrane protein required for beta-lactamase induction
MNAPNFLVVCLVGMLTVLVVHGILAGVFWLLLKLMPVGDRKSDAAVVAAVIAAAQHAHPQGRVTRVEEER